MTPQTVLSTKKLDGASIAILQQARIGVIEQEFISIESTIPASAMEAIRTIKDKTVVFTSSNAVHAVKELLQDVSLDVFCMEGKTKTAVQENLTHARITGTADSARSIAEKIIASGTGEVIFFCGNIRREELPALLQQHKVNVKEIIVYSTEETPVKISDRFDAVMFFSPSAVRSFFTLNTLSTTTVCFSIGNTTADEIKKHTTNDIHVASTPSEEVLVTTLTEYFKQVQ